MDEWCLPPSGRFSSTTHSLGDGAGAKRWGCNARCAMSTVLLTPGCWKEGEVAPPDPGDQGGGHEGGLSPSVGSGLFSLWSEILLVPFPDIRAGDAQNFTVLSTSVCAEHFIVLSTSLL